MGIFQRRKQKHKAPVAPITQRELLNLPYAFDFDLPREEWKLRAVHDHERAGGVFHIRKVFGTKGARARIIMTIGHFPDIEELAEMVGEMYGGGAYSVHPAGSPKVFKKYEVDMPSKFLTGGPKQKSLRTTNKDELLQNAWSWFETEADEETKEGMLRAVIEKELSELGIQLPPPPTMEEELLEKALEEDPSFRERFRQGLMEKQGYKKPTELGSIDQMIADHRKLKEIQELVGGRSGGWQEALKESGHAIVDILQAITNARSSGAAVGSAKVTPTQQPSKQVQAPEPDVANVDAANVKEGLPGASDVERIISRPRRSPANPSPLISSQPVQSPRKSPVEAQSLGDKNIDLTPRWSDIDWNELEQGVHGDPMDFLQKVQGSATDDNHGGQALAELIRDHEPPEILYILNQAVDSCVRDGRGVDYETAVLVLLHLKETVLGRDWLVKAHAAAKSLIAEVGPGNVAGIKGHGA